MLLWYLPLRASLIGLEWELMTLNGPRTCTYRAKWPRSLPGSAQTKGGKACLSVIGYERSVFVWIILFVFFFSRATLLVIAPWSHIKTHRHTQICSSAQTHSKQSAVEWKEICPIVFTQVSSCFKKTTFQKKTCCGSWNVVFWKI